MVVFQASKLNLPQSPSLSSPEVSSLLFDPHSLSLALMHYDSSFSLYPSLSPLSLSSLPPPQTLVTPPSSSAAFLRLQSTNPSMSPRSLFVVAAPLHGGHAVLLRFYILDKNFQSFAKARVICNQNGLKFDEGKSGVVFSVSHGASIKLVGSINVLAMYSVSNSKIWVFAAKMVNNDDGATVKLMKCAVIDCCAPVSAINISFGFLILGEGNGVRVFYLRPLVKGRARRNRKESKILHNGPPNGVIQTINGTDIPYTDSLGQLNSGANCRGDKVTGGDGSLEISSNGYLEGRFDKHWDSGNYVKLRAVKLRQDSKDGASCFVALTSQEVKSHNSAKVSLQSVKAISIQAMSSDKFLILDSKGDVHLCNLSNPLIASEIHCYVKQLINIMKVQKLAVLPDISTRTPIVWISDGCHTVQILAIPDADTSVCESDRNDCEEKLNQISVTQAIFTSEKIQDIIPLATNAILILGQGGLFAYAIS
ncbi:hypothetical protein NMG60_11006216 [Bertholletia excelsa]